MQKNINKTFYLNQIQINQILETYKVQSTKKQVKIYLQNIIKNWNLYDTNQINLNLHKLKTEKKMNELINYNIN